MLFVNCLNFMAHYLAIVCIFGANGFVVIDSAKKYFKCFFHCLLYSTDLRYFFHGAFPGDSVYFWR